MEERLSLLIAGCKKNDRKSQFELFKWWHAELMRITTRYKKNRDDAAALVNAAFFKVLTNLEKYESHISFDAWIRRIMLNTIIDEYRKDKKNMEIPHEFSNGNGEELIFNEDNIDYNLIEKEMKAEEAEKILYQLDENERVVFNMYEMDGYSHQEIADTIGISERTSKRYLSKAKINLQNLIKTTLHSINIL